MLENSFAEIGDMSNYFVKSKKSICSKRLRLAEKSDTFFYIRIWNKSFGILFILEDSEDNVFLHKRPKTLQSVKECIGNLQ